MEQVVEGKRAKTRVPFDQLQEQPPQTDQESRLFCEACTAKQPLLTVGSKPPKLIYDTWKWP